MENPISKHIEALRVKSVKLELAEIKTKASLTSKQANEITDNISANFTIAKWMEKQIGGCDIASITSFIPSKEVMPIFDFLSLDIGYKRTVKQAFDDEFPLLKELLKEVGETEFKLYKDKINRIKAEFIPLYIFFREEIETAYLEGISAHELIKKRISCLAEKARLGTKVSHAPKFTYPFLQYPRINEEANKAPDGFLRTGNIEVDFDMHIGAADLPVFKFLSLEINQTKLLSLFESGKSEEILVTFNVEPETYSLWELGFKKCLGFQNRNTNHRLKQVYFPVKQDYHLLSILSPSGIMFKLKERINTLRFSDEAKDARKSKEKNNPSITGFSDLYELSEIGYGGTKPQNISALNNQNHGTAYLLRSMPPELIPRSIQPPKTNFFSNFLWADAYKDDFQKLHAVFIDERNNIRIRDKRDRIVRSIIYQVVDRLWMVRHIDAGWSESENYRQLPKYQKIWLDQLYATTRDENTEWITPVKNDFARWFVNTYTKLLGTKALGMGDEQLLYFNTMVSEGEEALR